MGTDPQLDSVFYRLWHCAWFRKTRAQCTFALYVPLQQYGASHIVDSLCLPRNRAVEY